MMASACSSGFRRSSNGFRITNIEPKFELLALSSSDRPATPVVCLTPGISRVIRSMRSITSLVRCKDAESGSWQFTSSQP